MSFKADGPKVRPERVKPPPPSPPTDAHPNPPSWSRRSSTSSTTSFHSAHSVQQDRFSPAEESRMLSLSNDLKSQANTFFSRHDYESAIQIYDRALAELPRYLDYEMAVLQSNIAACHLKLEQWKDAVESCERGLDGLERELPTKKKEKAKKGTRNSTGAKKSPSTRPSNGKSRNGRLNSDTESDDEGASPPQSRDQAKSEATDDAVVELPSDEEDESVALKNLQLSDTRKADITRIRVKLLLRRARARSNMSMLPPSPSSTTSAAPSNASSPPGSAWSNLSAALEDYKALSSTPQYWETLPASDKKTVRDALVLLPPRIEEAKQKEVSEMMGKLKDLGNGILKPFGLSTDNFKVVQGEGGGYSLSFDGGGGGRGGAGKKG
ncbi:TPR repeat-containing protein [Cladophialophora immunda]|nr:TPR repeat-containing protein [Cladophialophora immunda]